MAKMLHFGTKTVDSTADFTVKILWSTVGMRGYSQMVSNILPQISTLPAAATVGHTGPKAPTAGYLARPLQRGIWVYSLVCI